MRVTKKKLDLANEPGWKKKDAAEERNEALKVALAMLQVNPRELERLPKFSEILADKSLGGLDQVLAAMRLSMDPLILKFVERYDQLNKTHKKIVPWEAIALLANIDGRHLLGAVILALREHSANEVKVAALTAHAKVTQATVEAALQPDGYRDRQMLHTALGFLAPPKGQTINFNFTGAEEGPESNREIAAEDIDMNELFPDLMTTQKKLLPD